MRPTPRHPLGRGSSAHRGAHPVGERLVDGIEESQMVRPRTRRRDHLQRHIALDHIVLADLDDGVRQRAARHPDR